NRLWQRDHRDFRAVQPDAGCYNDLVPPLGMLNNPMNAVTTKFVRTSTNKVKCPVFVIRWTPEGRRLVTGASSGEFTLWNGLTFNFETILQAHDSPVRAMTWSHNDMWMLTADHGGYVKYWQSNMNNVKMFQAHKEAIREARFIPNLPFSVVLLSAARRHAAAGRGRRLASRHPLLLLLWLIPDRCKCVLLQHCSDLLLMLFLMWLLSCLSLFCSIKSSTVYLHLVWAGPLGLIIIKIKQGSIKFSNQVNKEKLTLLV
ncbi:pre-mRNA 3' end processing protein WDR33-like, partial [Plectropomus leopardus]|uniref:pre-mRNA 3' end processing protein WDR33-like n=1 Tax=Plectropomus leopardus TaxID=160734 RepID=UPI001C4BB4B4